MADRPEPRVKTDLAVRVWGMGKEGRPFFQNAEARNISSEGAMISGLEQQLTPGDTIGVQYGDKKARFRVVWVIDAGAVHKIQAGVQLLEGQHCPWLYELGPVSAVPAPPPSNPANKRKFARHQIQIPIDLRDDHGGAHMQTNASDIGGRGCYVEALLPVPVDTLLTATFWIESEKFSTTAIVRASDPGVGMGIEFVGLDEEGQKHLQSLIEKVDPANAGLGHGKS